MKLRTAEWWEWATALQTLTSNDGAQATGMAWASHCWTWRRGLTEDDILGKGLAMHLEDFHARHRSRVTVRTVRRHFAELVACGLLLRQRGHSRYGPDVYVPRVPQGWAAPSPDEHLNRGHECPVLEEAEQGTPMSSASQQGTPMSTASDVNRGHQRPQQGTSGDTAPLSPEVVQTPLARTHAREGARAIPDEGGEGTSSKGDEHAAAAVAGLLAALPVEVARRVAPGFRARMQPRVLELMEQGWAPVDLAQAVNESSWEGARHVGAVLEARLRDLPAPAPAAPVVRRPDWCGHCDEPTRLLETDRGMARCPECHPKALRAAAVPA